MLPTDSDRVKITEEEKNKEKTEEEIKDKLKEIENTCSKDDGMKGLSPFLTSAIQKPESNEEFKQKIESATKSEITNKENVIFESNCNLYRFVPGKSTLESRGVGKIFINKVEEKDLYKIVMNRDKINRLGCNHYISPLAELSEHSTIKNIWIWHTFSDTSDKDSKLDSKQTFAVRIKNEEEYNAFKEKYDWARDYNKTKVEDAAKESENKHDAL